MTVAFQSMLVPVGIALGSNLGDPAAELDAAVAFLRGLSAGRQVRESPRIQTAPVDCPPGSGPFLNAVVEIMLDPAVLPPVGLLKQLQDFERTRGRPQAHAKNSPRSLDLDIIYYGDVTMQSPELTVPHPRAASRRFVLEPLAQLRPELILPGQVRTVRELLAGL